MHKQNVSVTRSYPVLLVHGLLDTGFDFFFQGPNKSVGFNLIDQGYDVWVMNVRGNYESRLHETLTIADSAFWDFTFEDMAYKDIPATIDFVLKSTNKPKLHYTGHSQGTQIFMLNSIKDTP